MSFYPDENECEIKMICPRSNKRTLTDSKSHYFLDSKSKNEYEEKKSKKPKPVIQKFKGDFNIGITYFAQPCINLAKSLLGKILVRQLSSSDILKGMIVETECYLGIIDKASHSFNGKRTQRNEAMYLKPGTAYVYTIYGMYYCFNISSLEEGSAVLIRALEPIEGISTMMEFRSKRKKMSDTKTKELCNGPSKLCQALQIDKEFNKVDISLSNKLWITEGIDVDVSDIIICKRIGIDSYGEEWGNKPLRFYIKNNSCVSHRNKIAEISHGEILTKIN